MQLRKVADLLGFTKTELTVISFLLGVFLFSFIINLFRENGKVSSKDFDYSLVDSLFIHSGENDSSDNEKDYKRDLLELNAVKVVKKASLPKDKSVDLNNADKAMLMSLPGIGEKTAMKIIDYRRSFGGFKSIDELQEVKGIGPAKFGKIKKYIFVNQ